MFSSFLHALQFIDFLSANNVFLITFTLEYPVNLLSNDKYYICNINKLNWYKYEKKIWVFQ